MSGGFFRGTSADQDTRFSNKQAKLLKSQKFAPELDQLVDTTKIKMDVMKPWIAKRVTELLGFEDEVLINFVYGLLEAKEVDGKQIQIQLTGFMEKNTGKFMRELWALLLSAQNNASGVPQQFLDEKEEELKKKKAESDRITQEIQKKRERMSFEEADQMNSKGMVGGPAEQEFRLMIDGEIAVARHMDDLTKYPQKHSGSRPAADERSEEERESDRRHDLRRRKRSPSDDSARKSPVSLRGIHPVPKSRSRSSSLSKSYSGDGHKSRDRSRSTSPPKRAHLRISPHNSYSPRVPSSRLRSPYSRRRSSPEHYHRSRSPIRRRSPVRRRRRSPTPSRRSSSPLNRRSPPSPRRQSSPSNQLSLSPPRRRSSPVKRISPSPPRRRPSPVKRRSPSPPRRRSSPVKRRSPSPPRHRSSSVKRRSPSPPRRRSSPVKRRSPSPPRRRSSPTNRRIPSPPRRRSSPTNRRSSSPSHNRSSPMNRRPSTPSRRRSSPLYRQSPSPLRHRSPLRSRRRHQSPPARRKSPTRWRSPIKPHRRSSSPSPPSQKSRSRRHQSPGKRSSLSPASSLQHKKRNHKMDNRQSPSLSHSSLSREHSNPPEGLTRESSVSAEEIEYGPAKMDVSPSLSVQDKSSGEKIPRGKDQNFLKKPISDRSESKPDRIGKRLKKSNSEEEESDYDSEVDHRLESKRRKREERRLRKEERRRRREERHKRKEERRTQKKSKEGESSEGEESEETGVRIPIVVETENDKRKLESELRQRALESLRAKKAINH